MKLFCHQGGPKLLLWQGLCPQHHPSDDPGNTGTVLGRGGLFLHIRDMFPGGWFYKPFAIRKEEEMNINFENLFLLPLPGVSKMVKNIFIPKKLKWSYRGV